MNAHGRQPFTDWALNAFRRREVWEQWYEGEDWVFGFRDPDVAMGFRIWSETCGIDWTVPRAGQRDHPDDPPERNLLDPPGYSGHPALSIDRRGGGRG